MNENIRESRRLWVWSMSVILCGLAGTWWGIRTGRGLALITGVETEPACCAAMLLALLIQGLSNLKRDGRYPMLYRILVWYSGIMIPILIYGLGCMVLLDVISWIAQGRLPLNYDRDALIAVPVSAAITLIGLIHARRIKIRKYTIQLAGLSRDMQPCRIVQLSDLHMGIVVGNGHIQRILRKTQELHPAYVMLTGDTFNHGFVEECLHPEKAAAAFRELNHAILTEEKTTGQAAQDNDITEHALHYAAANAEPSVKAECRKESEYQKDNMAKTTATSWQSANAEHQRDSAKDASQRYRQQKVSPAGKSKSKKQGNTTNHSEPSRIFAVLGNHDPLPADPGLQNFLKEANITLLHDRTISLPQFFLAGRGGNHINPRPALADWLPDQHPQDKSHDMPSASGKKALESSRHTLAEKRQHTGNGEDWNRTSKTSEEKIPEKGKHTKGPSPSNEKSLILLDHYPDGIYEAQALHVDLMLSGHTHGGQYFPCDLLIRKHYAHGRLVHGYSVWGNTQSIVSSGAGFFQIPIRIGTSSEIVCIDLVPKAV